MKNTILLLILLSFISGPLFAQQEKDPLSKGKLNVNIADIWKYNSYEGSRWGIGGEYVKPLKCDPDLPLMERKKVFASGYIGWGYRDHLWKYGFAAGKRKPSGPYVNELRLSYSRDLENLGAWMQDPRRDVTLCSPNVFNTSNHYSLLNRFGISRNWENSRRNLIFAYSHSNERFLFTPDSLIYLYKGNKVDTPYCNEHIFNEINIIKVNRQKPLTTRINGGFHHTADSRQQFFMRLQIEYYPKIAEGKWGRMDLYSRFGIATPDCPASRMFNLGGTAFAPFFYKNAFVTVRPNDFMSNAYAQANIRYTSPYLWQKKWTHPRIIAQANGMIGTFWNYKLDFYDTCIQDTYTFSSPQQGLIETALGIERLIKWGIMDLGVAIAMQHTPTSAPYHRSSIKDRCSLLATISLIWEE